MKKILTPEPIIIKKGVYRSERYKNDLLGKIVRHYGGFDNLGNKVTKIRKSGGAIIPGCIDEDGYFYVDEIKVIKEIEPQLL